jgi:hypothetical protein
MRKIQAILMAAVILGCAMKEEPVKTFTAVTVTKDNIFSYGSVAVKVNPNLDYFNIAGTVKKAETGVPKDPTIRDFYIFTRPGSDKIVLIETNTRSQLNPFQLPQDELMINIPVIQKGQKPINGKLWEIYIRALPEFPEQISSAVRQKGIRFEPHRCGLEIGAGKVLDRFHRIYIKYIKGINECQTLPKNGGILSGEQLQSIRELANQFDENITIANQSGGS